MDLIAIVVGQFLGKTTGTMRILRRGRNYASATSRQPHLCPHRLTGLSANEALRGNIFPGNVQAWIIYLSAASRGKNQDGGFNMASARANLTNRRPNPLSCHFDGQSSFEMMFEKMGPN